MKLGVGS
jgi:hypothetical protein